MARVLDYSTKWELTYRGLQTGIVNCHLRSTLSPFLR